MNDRNITTLDDVEHLDSGPFLDALVAHHVLGWDIEWDDTEFLDRRNAYAYRGSDGKKRAVPPFSIDTLHAELLVQAIREQRDGHFTLFAFTTGWKALGHTPDLLLGGGENAFPAGYVQLQRLAQADTRALAICRCALRTFVLDDWGPTGEELEREQTKWNEDMAV